ncbi:hypothetical protein [Bradyrhizobium sp. 150]|uniref:hypothetical protein n=1 Tax=Bradyrhizobium sp. 150 TaxID=2782625 RepID=UPI001FFBDE72|nr:hypothetical protein [Bradyrhizobium sp. 150]MCK1672723.1 hypothetical protein [Bradyrhizobium sp. 150]
MTQQNRHHLVDFASRYAKQSIKTFTPTSARWRALIFESEIDDLITLAKEADKQEIRFGSVYSSYEIITYYSVGLVTCLEWHARCRLVHLMEYRPGSIQTGDIKGIADLAISQMAANGIAVSHLLGTATKVSSIQEYVKVFQRLFDDLSIPVNVERTLRMKMVKNEGDVDVPLYERLEEMYQVRHALVHEISFSNVGPYAVRDVWSLENARLHASDVSLTIKLLEESVTKHAPADFPHRLDEDGFSEESRLEKLTDAIAALEQEITQSLANDAEGLKKWNAALVTQRAGLQAEIEFIEAAETLRPVRYYDVTEYMKEELLQSRIAFLTALKAETGH